MDNAWVKEILSGTILLIIVFYIFRNGGKDFSAVSGALTQSYTQSVTVLQGR